MTNTMLSSTERSNTPSGRNNIEAARNPGDAVAHVFELLETVLQSLPVLDLLLSQRVCKAFQATIEGSDLLQHKLFFRPDLTHFSSDNTMHRSLRVNTLLEDRVLRHRLVALRPGVDRLHVLMGPRRNVSHVAHQGREVLGGSINGCNEYPRLRLEVGATYCLWPANNVCKVCSAPPFRAEDVLQPAANQSVRV